MKVKKYFEGGETDPPKVRVKKGGEDKVYKVNEDFNIDLAKVKKGIKRAESANGKLMKSPVSTATGFYGQRWSEIKDNPMVKGMNRDMFASDTTAQNKVFLKRFTEGIGKGTNILDNTQMLYRDYGEQIKKKGYSPEEVAALTNYIGREGARRYFGYHVRDGKPLKEAVPNLFKAKNKTPDEYIAVFRSAFK